MQRNLAGACVVAGGCSGHCCRRQAARVAQEDDARNLTVEQTSIHAVQAPPPSSASNPLDVVAWVDQRGQHCTRKKSACACSCRRTRTPG